MALEALDNGVPLTIEAHFRSVEADAWIWDDSLVDLQLRYAIRYKPLSERYEVYRLPGGAGRNFVTREAAIAALGEIHDLQLLDQDELAPGKDYRGPSQGLPRHRGTAPAPAAHGLSEPPGSSRAGWTKWPLTP